VAGDAENLDERENAVSLVENGVADGFGVPNENVATT